MHFDLVSDLHLDCWPGAGIDWAKQKRSDILLVAGDIYDDPTQSIAELKRMAAVYPTVLFIDGNHEHLGKTDQMPKTRQMLREEIAKIPGVVYLHDKVFIKDGVAFAGRNGWWDFTIAEPRVNGADCRAAYDKARAMDRPASDLIIAQAKADAKAMTRRVKALQKRSDVVSIVAVTHTLPHPDGISWKVYPKHDIMAGAYGMRQDKAVAADTAHKIVWWVFGHNHDQRQFPFGHTTAISNPRGRPGDFNRVHYDVRTLFVPDLPPTPPAPKPRHSPAP